MLDWRKRFALAIAFWERLSLWRLQQSYRYSIYHPMPNLLSILSEKSSLWFSSAFAQPQNLVQHCRSVMAGAILLGLPFGTQEAIAQMSAPESLPAEISTIITAVEAAANAQDIDAVMEFYSPEFRHADGLSYQDFERVLSELWEQNPDLRYTTEVTGWKETDNGIVVETETTVTGTPMVGDRPFNYTSTITSEQRFEGQQIVAQRVLDEESTLTAGDQPPSVDVNLPDEVLIGRNFYFDAIVTDPLGDRRLLGAAINEPTNLEGYLQAPAVNFELLAAGGLFKEGEAPTVPGSRWISGILVHESGITATTQRLSVTSPDMIDPNNL